jgi:hypothetical protein
VFEYLNDGDMATRFTNVINTIGVQMGYIEADCNVFGLQAWYIYSNISQRTFPKPVIRWHAWINDYLATASFLAQGWLVDAVRTAKGPLDQAYNSGRRLTIYGSVVAALAVEADAISQYIFPGTT